MFKVRLEKNSTYESGKYYYYCPHCGAENSFFFVATINCRTCFKPVPDARDLVDDAEYRLKHYLGKERD